MSVKNNKSSINITLKYFNEYPSINYIKRIIKPSFIRYSLPEDFNPVKFLLGAYIISTILGLLTYKHSNAIIIL